MFFCVSVCNNYAFNFNIPMPLHMIFRAGSLIANMVMGMLILKKRYVPLKMASILMITLGIIICTLESGKEVKATDPKDVNSNPEIDYFWWVIGIMLLTVALFLSARMGIYQEVGTNNSSLWVVKLKLIPLFQGFVHTSRKTSQGSSLLHPSDATAWFLASLLRHLLSLVASFRKSCHILHGHWGPQHHHVLGGKYVDTVRLY